MGDQDPAIPRSPRQYLYIIYTGQVRRTRRLEIDTWHLSYRRQEDDLVQIGIRLKAHLHEFVCSCRSPARIRQFLIEHRVLLPRRVSHRIELRFGLCEMSIHF